ncbi:MAG TPA: ATP-binding cassette domain-containing protein [bacterium]|nr:ATP-binding cassette domain-containing protein [bacterium]
MDTVIKLEQVSFAFDTQYALEDVNLEVKERDFIGIIGPNGGGKTTLLRLILGLLKPTKGTVAVLGSLPEKKRGIFGYVPQNNFMDIQFPIKVKEVVAMGLVTPYSFFPWFNKEKMDRVHNTLKEVSIENLEEKKFGELSAGQRQRCLIARALVSRPAILLLDEPTASVDNTVEKDIYELFRSLSDKLTIILVSHDLGVISSYVNKVVCVNRQLVSHDIHEVSWEKLMNDTYKSDMTMIRHKCKL